MGRNLLESSERPALAFRNNDITYVTGNQRVDFSIGSAAVRTYATDRNDKKQYGLLEGNAVAPTNGAPSDVDVDRIRDMVLYYGSLLEEDRLMPPQ
jgi:hypothetical protein